MRKQPMHQKYISNIFLNEMHGVCVKFLCNDIDKSKIFGYFTRAEVGTDESGNKIVVVDFTNSMKLQLKMQLDGNIKYEYINPSSIKTIAMERMIKHNSNNMIYCENIDDAKQYIVNKFYNENSYFEKYAEYLTSSERMLKMSNLLDNKQNIMIKKNAPKLNSIANDINSRVDEFNEYLHSLLNNIYKYYKDSQIKLFVLA